MHNVVVTISTQHKIPQTRQKSIFCHTNPLISKKTNDRPTPYHPIQTIHEPILEANEPSSNPQRTRTETCSPSVTVRWGEPACP
jgi:hypothetical protein